MAVSKKEDRDLFNVKPVEIANKKKRKIHGGDKKKGEEDSSFVTEKIESLSSQSLVQGQLILGCISEIRELELVLSLPHRITAFVSATRVCEAFTELLKQIPVTEKDGGTEPCTLAELFSPCQFVVACVDRLDNINGFIKAIAGVGSIIRCAINKIIACDDGVVSLKLSADPETVCARSLPLVSTVNLALLMPGTTVDTVVERVLKDGLQLTLASFEGVVSKYHLKSHDTDLTAYQPGQNVRAHVLFVAPLTNVVHMTLQEWVCTTSLAVDLFGGMQLGQIVDEAKVLSAGGYGAYLRLGEAAFGFCPVSRLSDSVNPSKNAARKFPIGMKHKCRILHFSYMDRLFIVSMQKSVLEQQAMSYRDVMVGSILQAKIKSHTIDGAQVALSYSVDGFIPLMHLCEGKTLRHPQLKHPVGETVTVRVLKVLPEKRQVHLTTKAELVKAEETLVVEYTKEVIGTVTIGHIAKVNKSGLLVVLFNDVKGFVPKHMVSTDPVDDLATIFFPGQVVKCIVTEVEPELRKMILSLVTEGLVPYGKKNKTKLSCREKVSGVIEEKDKNSLKLRVTVGEAEGNTSIVNLPMVHLSDHSSVAKLIFAAVKEGDEIRDAIVFRKDGAGVTVTLKPIMYQWINEEGQKGELKEGHMYPAVVSDVRSYGVMVVVPIGPGSVKGLVHMANVCDQFIHECTQIGLQVGQSLMVKCKGQDKKGRPLLSSALKDTIGNGTQASVVLLNGYLRDLELLKRCYIARGGMCGAIGRMEVGQRLKGQVETVMDEGVGLQLEGGIMGLLTRDHFEGKLSVGEEVHVCVLHVDFAEKCVHVSMKPEVMKNFTIQGKPEIGQSAKCEVLLVMREFALVMLRGHCPGLAVYLPLHRHLNDLYGMRGLYVVGRRHVIVVQLATPGRVLGSLHVKENVDAPCDIYEDGPQIFCKGKSNLEESGDDSLMEGLQEKYSAKIKRIRCDSLVSNASDESNVMGSSGKLKRARLISDGEEDIPQVDEMAYRESVQQKRLERRKAKKKENLKIRAIEQKIKNETQKENRRKQESEPKKLALTSNECIVPIEDDSDAKECLGGGAFEWALPENPCLKSELSDDEQIPVVKKEKVPQSERIAKAKSNEQRVHETECSRLDKSCLPQSILDFEEKLQLAPNSSALWIQFISFYLESSEVDTAKGVAYRALQTMDKRQECERMNLWTVLLRLEVMYGTPDSAEKAFREALVTNDQMNVYAVMADIYEENSKLQEAEKIHRTAIKKFSRQRDVWVKAAAFFFRQKKPDVARNLLDKAVLSLYKNEHIDLVSRMAQLEFQLGEPERGTTLFETLLSSFPKRVDIWNVYVDLLIKKNDIDGARHVMERMSSLKLRMKKMRSVFKKMLDFEKKHGTPQTFETVRTKVEDYVAEALKQSS